MKSQWQKEIRENPKYWGRIVAISDDKIIDVDDDYTEIFNRVLKMSKDSHFYTVPKRMDVYHINPFRIKNSSAA